MPQIINGDTIKGEVFHEWTIQEYEQHERGFVWYVLTIILGIGLVGYGLFTGNFLFALIIVLFAIILFLQAHQPPQQVLFQITDLGVVVGRRFYPYSEFSGFYIIYNPPEVKTLFFDSNSVWRPLLRVPLLDKNPVELKHSLREFLEEEVDKEQEPLSDRVARNWRIH